MLAVVAFIVLAPLLYLPGFLIARALLGADSPPDLLERHFERVVAGVLLNGWLAFTLAELGLFSAWLHILLVAGICATAWLLAWRRGALALPGVPLGIVARGSLRVAPVPLRQRLLAHWDVVAFALVGLVFLVLVARPFEVVLGARDAGVYATTGFAIARTGSIVQHDPLLAQIAADQQAADPTLRAAAEQAETNFLGPQHPERTIATRLRQSGYYINAGELEQGRVVPQFFHLYPVWIGLLAALLGYQGGLLATGLMGFLGLWSVGMLGRRLAGRWVGLLGMAFLALNGVQVWFSRYSTAEATAQFYVFAGLYAFAVMQTRMVETQPVGALPQGRAGRLPRWTPAAFAALIAGLAFGQLAFTHLLYSIATLPFVFAYLFYIWLTRRWGRVYTLFGAGFGLMLLHSALHVVFIARAYFFDTLYARLQDFALTALAALPFLTPTLQVYYLSIHSSKIGIRLGPAQYEWNIRRIVTEIAIVLLVVLAVLALRRWGQPLLRRVEQTLQRWACPLLGLMVTGIAVFACYGYLVRPQILTPESLTALPACLNPAQIRQPQGVCLDLQGYIGAPIIAPAHPDSVAYTLSTLPAHLRGQEVPPRISEATELNDRAAIYQGNMVRVGWYLSPLGMVLGVVGLLLWWRNGMNRASWLFLLVALLSSVLLIRAAYGASDQHFIYILRRFLPQVYPAFSLGMAFAIVALARGWRRTADEDRSTPAGGWRSLAARRSSLVAAAALTLALLGFFALTNRTIYRHVEYGGALAQLEAQAARFSPDDVLLLRGGDVGARDLPDMVATPLTYAYGLNAFTIKSPDPGAYAEQLARYVQRWQDDGRQVYLVLGASGATSFPGFALEPAGRLQLNGMREFEQLRNQKPTNTYSFDIDFAVYRLIPQAGPVEQQTAAAVDDYAPQVRGFFRPETISGVPVAWTNGDALLRIPWQGTEPLNLTLSLAGGVRPVDLPAAQACVSFLPAASYALPPPDAPFTARQCVTLDEQVAAYQFTLDPSELPAAQTSTLLVRIESETWIPARSSLVPPSNDGRPLGVQYGGLNVTR